MTNSKPFQAWFQCSNGCKARIPIDAILYRCPQCSSLLEVEHDLEALSSVSGASWKELFDSRALKASQNLPSSGVWSKKEWVHPSLDFQNIVSFGEGNTPLTPLEPSFLGIEQSWIKQCGISHTGSFKDLGMTVLVSNVLAIRKKNPHLKAVACASTGDTSAALAAYCARAKIPCLVLLPAGKISMAQLLQPITNGAVVCSLRTDFDGCMQVVQELCAREDVYLANSLNSLRIEGQKTISIELMQQLNWQTPDWIVIPGGNLGNVSALGQGFLMMQKLGLIDRLPRLACAQAEHANPLYLSYKTGFQEQLNISARPTLASAIQIGAPVSYPRAIRVLKKMNGVVEQASEQDIATTTARADRIGLQTCPHTAVALACTQKLVQNKTIAPDEKVVVVSTAHGLKFMDFKAAYHQDRLENLETEYSNKVQEIEPDINEVLKILDQRLR